MPEHESNGVEELIILRGLDLSMYDYLPDPKLAFFYSGKSALSSEGTLFSNHCAHQSHFVPMSKAWSRSSSFFLDDDTHCVTTESEVLKLLRSFLFQDVYL